MAQVISHETRILVQVEVTYKSAYPLDTRRQRFIEEQLQEFADTKLRDTLRILRYSDETEGG